MRPIVEKLKGEFGRISPRLIRSEWNTTSTFAVAHPVNGEEIARVPNCGLGETQTAIEKAKLAQIEWASKTAKERAGVIKRWGDLMMTHEAELAALITAENGKPISESKGEVAYAASFCEWSGEEARRCIGETIPSPFPNARIVTIKQPIGVVGMVTPWNFPAAMVTRKAAPALAVGCSVVLKPSEDTPLTALALGQLAAEAGLPEALYNVLPSDRQNAAPIGNLLCTHPDVRALSFTGSTHVGSVLLKQSAEQIKKVSLELGGLGPFMVFASADLEAAVDGLLLAKFRNTGQTCVCANNILVEKSIHDEFVEILAAKMASNLRFGDAFDPTTTVSCLINARGADKVEAQIQNAIEGGAKLLLGGERLDSTHIEPTLLTNVNPDSDVFCHETFGPVAAVAPFETEDEALAIANRADVGLAGYFYSRDQAQCWRVAEKLEVGMVGVNTGAISAAEGPFGGVKRSGLGREGSTMGTEEFLETKYMCIGGL